MCSPVHIYTPNCTLPCNRTPVQMQHRSDSDDGEADVSGYAPAYALGAATPDGPQCSAFPGEFCFFCAYERDPNAEAGSHADMYGSLAGLVKTMASAKREFHAIVEAVASAYNTQIKSLITDPTFGHAPTWGTESIARHLTYSSQFQVVFHQGVTQIFHSLVANHNRHMLDKTTGQVIETERQALMSTLGMFMKWEKFQESAGRKGGTADR